MEAGLIGGIAGGIIGLIGGLVGTYAAIRSASGPREKAFTIKASSILWTGGILFISLLLFLPDPWRHMVWIPYGILLPLAIIKWNKTQQKIREEESSLR